MASKSKFDRYKRTVLITGSTDGIGRQTALELASRPKENFVIVHGRNAEKCEATVDYIVRENKLPDKSNIDYIVADFSDLKEVVNMTEEIEKRFPTLNVVLCNAGVLEPRRTESRNGLELTLQVNYLAHFVLINRLLPLLEVNQPSRIICVSSALHSWNKIDWDDIMAEKEYDKYLQYSRSKLMVHMMAFALHRDFAKRGSQSRVTSNAVELGKTQSVSGSARHRSVSVSSEDVKPDFGAVASLKTLIESASLSGVSGKYFGFHGRQIRSGSDATDERLQAKLRKLSEDLCREYLRKEDVEE